MIDQNTFEAMAKANRFAVHNGIVIRQLEMGKAEAVLEMGPNCLNPFPVGTAWTGRRRRQAKSPSGRRSG